MTIQNAINLKSRVDQSTWDSEMLCKRPRRSDCVLPEFDPNLHIADTLPDRANIAFSIAGMDLGIRAPTVVLFAHVDTNNTVWVAHEYIRSGVSLSEHIDQIRAAPITPTWILSNPPRHKTMLEGCVRQNNR